MLNDKIGSLLLEECTILKKYNHSLVKNLERQIEYVEQLIKELKEANVLSKETSLNYAFLNFYKKRCEKIIKTYYYNRFQLTTDNNLEMLSDKEIDTWNNIKLAEKEYLDLFPDIDFKKNETPPDQIYIQIVCLKDCGIVYDGDDLLELLNGRIYYVKRKAVEHLLQEGSIEIIKY